MLVINLEPYGYSEKAKEIILSYAKYIESSWETVLNEPARFYAEAIIVRLQKYIGKDELDLFPNLTTVVSAATGLDHLDMDEIEKRNIRVVSLRKHKSFLETISSTAEHAFALMLSLVRYIPAANEDVKTGNWNRDAFRGTVKIKNTWHCWYGQNRKKSSCIHRCLWYAHFIL